MFALLDIVFDINITETMPFSGNGKSQSFVISPYSESHPGRCVRM